MKNFWEKNKGKVLFGVGIFVFILCSFGIVANTKTQAKRLENAVETAAADITIAEKERTDKLDLLQPTVKASAKHEENIIASIADGRKKVQSNLDDGNLGGVQKEMSKVMGDINVLVENYPEITATDAYIDFMNASAVAESKIAGNRNNYNAAVRNYNDFVDGTVNGMLLNFGGYKVKELELLDFGKEYEEPKDYNWD